MILQNKKMISTSALLLLLAVLLTNNRFLLIEDNLSIDQIDTNEYAPGYPNIKMSALAQLKTFPLPRFKQGNKLMRNFLWMDPAFLGGSGQKEIPAKTAIQNSVGIEYELASNWNYYLQVSPNTSADQFRYGKPETFQSAWIKLANEHPELPASAISYWIGMRGNHVMGQKLSDVSYLKDSDGNFITNVYDNNGVQRGRNLLSPGIPLDTVALDGVKQRSYLQKLFQLLKRPLDFINKEDEIFAVYNSSTLEKSPSLVADKTKLKINDWDIYEATKIKQVQQTYRDSFMLLPQLKTCLYSVYAVDGHTKYRFAYSEMRKVNSQINRQYYSTPDFYPRYPYNWRYWKGPWHGLSWIFESRPDELAVGDSLYSP